MVDKIQTGLDRLSLRMDILNKLKEGEEIEGYKLCDECNGSTFGKERLSYCKKCKGKGYERMHKKENRR